MTSVWPALCPPWKRTTMSACSDSQSTIFPFPSSPHWEPTTTTLAMRAFPTNQSALADLAAYNSDLGATRDRCRDILEATKACPALRNGAATYPPRLRPNRLIFRALFPPCRRAALTTSDDSALPKAISRQHRGRLRRLETARPQPRRARWI